VCAGVLCVAGLRGAWPVAAVQGASMQHAAAEWVQCGCACGVLFAGACGGSRLTQQLLQQSDRSVAVGCTVWTVFCGLLGYVFAGSPVHGLSMKLLLWEACNLAKGVQTCCCLPKQAGKWSRVLLSTAWLRFRLALTRLVRWLLPRLLPTPLLP
jgi:hypothetical protein